MEHLALHAALVEVENGGLAAVAQDIRHILLCLGAVLGHRQ
jgi:hypothetical protein